MGPQGPRGRYCFPPEQQSSTVVSVLHSGCQLQTACWPRFGRVKAAFFPCPSSAAVQFGLVAFQLLRYGVMSNWFQHLMLWARNYRFVCLCRCNKQDFEFRIIWIVKHSGQVLQQWEKAIVATIQEHAMLRTRLMSVQQIIYQRVWVWLWFW